MEAHTLGSESACCSSSEAATAGEVATDVAGLTADSSSFSSTRELAEPPACQNSKDVQHSDRTFIHVGDGCGKWGRVATVIAQTKIW